MNGNKHWSVLLAIISAQALHNSSSGASIQSALRKELSLPGEVFLVDGHTAFIIPAKVNSARNAKPWVWYAPTLPGLREHAARWVDKVAPWLAREQPKGTRTFRVRSAGCGVRNWGQLSSLLVLVPRPRRFMAGEQVRTEHETFHEPMPPERLAQPAALLRSHSSGD